MENASKALIIAGAILLSILIIAFGIYVFNMAKSATNTNSLDELQIQAFNDQFKNYEGKLTGSQVKSLIDKMISNAGVNKEADEKLPDLCYIDWNGTKATGPNVNVNGQAGFGQKAGGDNIVSDVSAPNSSLMTQLRNGIANTHYYQVTMEPDETTGLIKIITIKY